MEIEDGVIWVYGVGEDGVMAFTDFGIENLDRAHQDAQERSYAAQALGSIRMICMRSTPDAFEAGSACPKETVRVRGDTEAASRGKWRHPKVKTTAIITAAVAGGKQLRYAASHLRRLCFYYQRRQPRCQAP